MIDVARRHGRVVQVGTQQRSGPHYQRARELIESGHIGQVARSGCGLPQHHARLRHPARRRPPPELDWDLMLGPAPQRPYNPNRALYHFRWFWDYSGGQMTNLGQHALDIVHWCLGLEGPIAVTSAGGGSASGTTARRPTPRTRSSNILASPPAGRTARPPRARPRRPARVLRPAGKPGDLAEGLRRHARPPPAPENAVPRFAGAHPVGGPARAASSSSDASSGPRPSATIRGTSTTSSAATCATSSTASSRGETPISDLESSHRVVTACHLANLSLRLGRKLRWDPARETILDDPEAARCSSVPIGLPGTPCSRAC